jgi:serpin B
MSRTNRRTTSTSLILWGLLASLAGGSCGDSTIPGTGDEQRSSLARITAPVVSPDDAAALAADNRAFAADMYGVLRGASGNLVYAPASVSIAMAMLYGGAAGGTAAEVAQAMHFVLPPERLHPAFDALDLALTTPPSAASGFQLSIANAAWGDQGYQFLPPYLDLLALWYGAGMRLVDYASPEPARQQINQWVADNTQQQITELLPAGAITINTRLVLTNAVYFQARWLTPFNPMSQDSPDGTFHAPSGDVTAHLMTGPDIIPLWTGAGFQAAAVPYVGNTTTMIVIVPDAGTFDAFEQGLTGDLLGTIFAGQSTATLGALILPRFKFVTKTNLVATLESLGMKQAFQAAEADFSGIDGGRDLHVTDVVHQATIAVDDQGTVASGATGAVFSRKSAVQSSLRVDRPFLFAIRDDATGAILFQGRVVDPTQ